jgi:hypothetical protein
VERKPITSALTPVDTPSWRRSDQPLYRYESTDPEVIDGALFGFVHVTDPEIILVIEARKGSAGPELAIHRGIALLQATVNVMQGTSAMPDCGFGRGSGWANPLRSTDRTRNS